MSGHVACASARSALVRDFMTSGPVPLYPGVSARDALRVLASHHVRHAPVLDAQGKLLGAVSRMELLDALLEEEAPSVGDVLERMGPPVATRGDACIHAVARYMLHEGVTCLAVLDDDGQTIGILTNTDFLREYVRLGLTRGCHHEGVSPAPPVLAGTWPPPGRNVLTDPPRRDASTVTRPSLPARGGPAT